MEPATKQLLIEVKHCITQAITVSRSPGSSAAQKDSVLDNLAESMYAIELHLSGLGGSNDQI